MSTLNCRVENLRRWLNNGGFLFIDDGLPKVHEHDGLPPQGFAVFHEGRMVIFYGYESNISDARTNPEVHNPPPSLRTRALQMGVNILVYALTSGG